MTGDMSGFHDMSQKAIDSAQGNIASDKGIGEPLITEFLKKIPGINKNTVTQQLARRPIR
jgi:hypothetical protein